MHKSHKSGEIRHGKLSMGMVERFMRTEQTQKGNPSEQGPKNRYGFKIEMEKGMDEHRRNK